MRTVDVSSKFETHRSAKAVGKIRLKPETIKLIKENRLPKGNLVEATKLTGIFGAKKTGDILPFCHPISLDFVEVQVKVNEDSVEVFSEVRGIARTGYEMEALTAVSTALLNIYDMCKGVDDTMVIEEIKLTHKSGGKSDWKDNLKGLSVKVVSEDEGVKELVLEFIRGLGASESSEPHIEIHIGERPTFANRFSGLESVMAWYDFRRSPKDAAQEVLIGKSTEGKVLISLPANREKIELFFTTFGGILRSLI